MSTLRLDLPDELLEAIAERSAALVLERLEEPAPVSPYLTVAEAAAFLRSSRQRVYDLLSAGRLARHKDGSRVLIARAQLEAHVNGVAPTLPTGRRSRAGRGGQA